MRFMFAVPVALTGLAVFAQDVVQLAPDRVKVVFENDHVRVLRFTEPHAASFPCIRILPMSRWATATGIQSISAVYSSAEPGDQTSAAQQRATRRSFIIPR
jgi:hypothetical protein